MEKNPLDHLVEIKPDGLTIVVNKADIRHDIQVFLDYIDSRGIKRAFRDNSIPKADLVRLAKVMGDEETLDRVRANGYSPWISRVARLCRQMKFIEYDTQGVYAGYSSSAPSFPDNYIELNMDRVLSYLDLPLQEQENKLQECLTNEVDPCASEFFSHGPRSLLDRFSRSGCATSIMEKIDFPGARSLLLSVLAPCIPGKWYSVKSLIDFFKTRLPYFLIPEKIPKLPGTKNRYDIFKERQPEDNWYRTAIEPTSPMAFERVEGRYIERFLEGAPLTMGYIELAYHEKSDVPAAPSMGQIRAFKITERFRQAISQEIKEPVVTVLPNFEIHVASLFYPARVIRTLSLFCDIKNNDIHTIMKLSRAKVITSLAADDSLDPVKTLRDLTQQPLPGNVEKELETWRGRAETFILYEGFALLEGKTAATYAKDYIVEKAGRDIHIIHSPQKVYQQLETALQVPLVIKHPETRLKSPDKQVKSVFSKACARKKTAKQTKKNITVKRSVVTTFHFPANGHFDEVVRTLFDMEYSVTANHTARTLTFPGPDEKTIKEALQKVDKDQQTRTKITDI